MGQRNDHAIDEHIAGRVGRANIVAGTAGSVLEWFAARPLGGVVFGRIGDKVGRRPPLLFSVFMMGGASLAIGLLPVHAQIGSAAAILLVLAHRRGPFRGRRVHRLGHLAGRARAAGPAWLFAALLGLTVGVAPAAMSEMLPARVRCMAVGIGYNVTMALFGGTAPLMATYLVARTADDFMPAYYMMVVAALSFIAVRGLPERAGTQLS